MLGCAASELKTGNYNIKALITSKWLAKINAKLDGSARHFCMHTEIVDRGADYSIRFPAHMRSRMTPHLAGLIRDALQLSKPIKFTQVKHNIEDTPKRLENSEHYAKAVELKREFESHDDVKEILDTFSGSKVTKVEEVV